MKVDTVEGGSIRWESDGFGGCDVESIGITWIDRYQDRYGAVRAAAYVYILWSRVAHVWSHVGVEVAGLDRDTAARSRAPSPGPNGAGITEAQRERMHEISRTAGR